jgi:acetoin utilization deacetylase AcuC-like enzyme
VFTHPRCLEHDPGYGHPESPARLRAILELLHRTPGTSVREAAPAPRDALLRVHPAGYLDELEAMAGRGGGVIDPDTIMSSASWEAALGSAGAALAATRHAIATGGAAFAAGRPPGHHALADRAMGFCFLANAVLAAREAQALGREKVLIVDWDVHHGNGTQALVERDPTVRFVSMHESPGWPGTGKASERGVGNILNVPMPAGLPPARYVAALLGAVREATREWPPDFVIISAGYDSMRGDPLGGFTLEPEHYGEVVGTLRTLAPNAPLVALLEGGYAPPRLAEGVVATLAAMS